MIFYIGLGLLGGFVLAFIFSSFRSKQQANTLASQLEKKVNEIFPKINEQLILMADQKLGAEKKEIKTDLDNKKTAIKELIDNLKKDLEKSNKKLEEAEKDRIGSFRELKSKVEEQTKLTENLRNTTKNLSEVLSDNRLRGQFGEQVAENLLRMTGFVKGIDYEFNKQQKESKTRPDFCVFLPDGMRVNVDSKFPYSNLKLAVETEDEQEKSRYLRKFSRDVKEKIKQVTSRDYINPESNTVDFVILFVPNEMVFSYIYDEMNEVWIEAMKKKVILAGPFSFTAILRMIRQAYDNFRYQENIYQIITQIKEFEKQFKKYNEAFEKIGSRIESLTRQYRKVDSTRTNQLVRAIDKIQLDQPKQLTADVEE